MKEEGRERLGKFSVKSKEAVKSEEEARQVRPEAVAYRTQEAGGRKDHGRPAAIGTSARQPGLTGGATPDLSLVGNPTLRRWVICAFVLEIEQFRLVLSSFCRFCYSLLGIRGVEEPQNRPLQYRCLIGDGLPDGGYIISNGEQDKGEEED